MTANVMQPDGGIINNLQVTKYFLQNNIVSIKNA